MENQLLYIVVTGNFFPRQIWLSVDICRRHAEQTSTCNACQSEVFNVESHMLWSNSSSVRVKVIANSVKQIESEARL